MLTRRRVGVIVVLVLFVVIGTWTRAQVSRPPSSSGVPHETLVAPTVVAGSDLGFRIEGYRDNVPVGTIVVRIDGRWVEAQVGGRGIDMTSAR